MQTAAIKPHSWKPVLIGGLVAGTLDGLAAAVQFYIKQHREPWPVFPYIASAAIDKGTLSPAAMTLCGILFHYLVAFLFTAFFVLLYNNWNLIRKNIIVSGILYGLLIWVIMNKVVLPASKLAPLPFDWQQAAIAAAILVCMVGLPVALITKKYAGRSN